MTFPDPRKPRGTGSVSSEKGKPEALLLTQREHLSHSEPSSLSQVRDEHTHAPSHLSALRLHFPIVHPGGDSLTPPNQYFMSTYDLQKPGRMCSPVPVCEQVNDALARDPEAQKTQCVCLGWGGVELPPSEEEDHYAVVKETKNKLSRR